MFSAIKQAIFILFCAIGLAALVNFIRPDGIAWIRHQEPVSKTASHANAVATPISLSAALEAFQAQRAVFVDARNPDNYDEAHIPGAINVPPDQFEADTETFMNQISPNEEVIVYCDGPGCHLAETLVQLMHQVGYQKMVLFADGWQGWKKENLPMTSGKEDTP